MNRTLVLAGVLAALALTGRAAAQQTNAGTGTLSATLSGAPTPSFRVDGLRVDQGRPVSWATARHLGTGADETYVVAATLAEGASQVTLQLDLPGALPNTVFRVSSDCSAKRCQEIRLTYLRAGRPDVCMVEDGQIAVGVMNAGRIKGTFSGSGTCLISASMEEREFTVSDGRFDVPIPTNADGPAVAGTPRPGGPRSPSPAPGASGAGGRRCETPAAGARRGTSCRPG